MRSPQIRYVDLPVVTDHDVLGETDGSEHGGPPSPDVPKLASPVPAMPITLPSVSTSAIRLFSIGAITMLPSISSATPQF